MDLQELRRGGRELRIDVGTLRTDGRRTPQGFLRVPGKLTRTGVLTYYRPDGSKFRELRHPEEVFNPDSLGSLAFAPVTERHPAGLVSPKNVSKVQVGIVTGARQDGRFVAGDLVVQSDPTIARVLGGKLKELSPGYTCRIDHQAGEWNGERYDGIQRAIVYNHLAIGPREWGRSGPEVALKLDAKSRELAGSLIAFERYDAQDGAARWIRKQMDLRSMDGPALADAAGIDISRIQVIHDSADQPTEDEADSICRALGLDPRLLIDQIPEAHRRTRGARRMDTRTIRVDGVEIKVDAAMAGFIEKTLSDRAAEVLAQTKRADEAEGKLAGVTTERDELKTKLDAASDPKVIAEAVAARSALEKGARKVLGREAKLDDKTDREIRAAVIVKSDSTADLDGKSDEYVAARFDTIVAAAPEGNTRNDTRSAIRDARRPEGETRTDDKGEPIIDSAEAAKARARQDAAEQGRKNLRVSVS